MPNLPPCPPAASPPRPRLLLHGLDSLYVSFFFGLSGVLDFDALAAAKASAAASRSRMAELTLGGEPFAVLPHGKKPYSYVLAAPRGDFELRLAERLQPSCHVQFAAEALWRDGAAALVSRVTAWAARLGAATLKPEKVARADFAFDYHLPGGADFIADHLLSRASKDNTYRQAGRVQTITAGRGDVVLRLYDKVAEIEQQSGKGFFFPLWGQREDVWRVEFQVRGDRLPAAGILSFADLLDHGPDLLRVLASEHSTLRRPNADSNAARWPLHPLWHALQADIADLAQTGLLRDLDGWQPSHDYRLWHQLRSLTGSLKGIACTLAERDSPKPPPALAALLAALPRMLAEGDHYHPALWEDDLRQALRRRGYGL